MYLYKYFGSISILESSPIFNDYPLKSETLAYLIATISPSLISYYTANLPQIVADIFVPLSSTKIILLRSLCSPVFFWMNLVAGSLFYAIAIKSINERFEFFN